ncbi:MAG: MFS transporter [Lewinella sp.]|nr:MFS transporter [Lewinella sp.]
MNAENIPVRSDSHKLSVGEKVGYSLGDLAANLVFQTLITYLAYFYTDIYGLSTEDASLIILTVGLVAAFAFNPVLGVIADRTKTRWGKFRPWILWTAIPLGLAALFAFSTPDFSYKGKVIYAIVTYTFLLLLYAANNLPYSALSGVITGDMAERNSVSSYRFVAVMVAQFFVQVFMYDLILKVGDGDKALGIERLMTILAIIGSVLLLITFFTTRERVVPKPEQESSLRDDLSDLVKNRPWLIMLTLTTLVFITLALKGGSYVYYFENYVSEDSLGRFLQPLEGFLTNTLGLSFENPTSMGLGVFNGGGVIFMIVGISLSKRLADKFGKRDVFMTFLFLSTLFILVFYFFQPESVGLMFGAQMLHGFFYGVTIPILWAMIADVADYSEWKNNRRATAIIFSAMMVGLKAGLSIGQALVTGILGWYDYISKQPGLPDQIIVQPETAVEGTRMLVSIYPSIFFLIGVGLLFFYEINKRMETQIEQDLITRRG